MTVDSNSKHNLVRGLGLIAAISVVVGNVIGTGVFFKARVMTCNLGSPGWVLIAWVAAGFLSLAGALTYSELAAMRPRAGAEYVILREAYGRMSSFLYGWMQVFIAKTGSQAAVAVAFAIALNDFLDGGLKQTVLKTEIFGFPYEITSLQIIAVMMIIIFTTLNCASVILSGQIASALTFIKVALILFVGFGAFVFASGGDFGHFGLTAEGGACEAVDAGVRYGSAQYSFTAGFAAAMLGALWGYDGWNNLTFVAGEVENPGRNIPLAIVGSTLLIIILYVTVHIGYFFLLDPTVIANVSKDSAVAKVVVEQFFGGNAMNLATGAAVAIFTVGLMMSSLGTLHTSILAGSRVPYAMASDGMMFKIFAKLSINGVPITSLVFQGLWASLLALSGSFDTLTDYVIFGSWIFYALVTSSLFVFRFRLPDEERPYRAWGYPVIPILFLLSAGWLLINTLVSSPRQSVTGIILILAGLPIYYFLNRKNGGVENSAREN